MIRTLRQVGLALVVAGALLLVTATVGFSEVSADRTVSITVADDPEAYLGVVDNSYASGADILDQNDTGDVYYLDDNIGEFGPGAVTVRLVAVERSDGTIDSDPGLDATVESAPDGTGHDFVVQVACSEGSTESGSLSVTVELKATGDVTIQLERTTNEPIDVNCDVA